MKKIQIALRMPPELWDLLRANAKKNHATLTAWILRILWDSTH